MKKNLILTGLIILINFTMINAQEYLKQIIIAEGAGTEVYVSHFNPENGETTVFDTINTGYVQDVIVDGGFAYVAANNYVVKYNIDTYQRVGVAEIENVNKLAVYNNQLFVGRWLTCTDGVYLKVFDKNNLGETLYEISEVDDQTYGFAVANDTVYLAVFGGYGAPEGKIAVIDPATQSFVRNIDLGTDGEGIGNLITDDYSVYFVNETYNWSGDTVGAIGIYNIATGEVFIDFYQENIGRGYAVNGTALFFQINGNVGVYNLYAQNISNNELITGPGGYDAISSLVFDKVNSLFYVATTDYFSYGEGKIYDIFGNQTGSFNVGIASDAMAADYRTVSGVQNNSLAKVVIGPNPATDKIFFYEQIDSKNVKIIDINGKVFIRKLNNNSIDISDLSAGIYFISFDNKSAKFIKE
jgi:hypothetical protein